MKTDDYTIEQGDFTILVTSFRYNLSLRHPSNAMPISKFYNHPVYFCAMVVIFITRTEPNQIK